jgi:nucleoside-diphosphate-sugar epimerase
VILITGATGFLGYYVIRSLVQAYATSDLRCFVRPESNTGFLKESGIELAYGDLGDSSSLAKALNNVDIFINLASLGFGHASNIISACEASNIQRAIFISTTAIFTTLDTNSKEVRKEAEERIQNSRLAYTILRPTMIYGSERDRNICRLINFLNKSPVIPILGSGDHLQQPVYVQDVAEAIRQSLENEETLEKAYNIAGATPLTYNAVIDIMCLFLGRRCVKIHLPLRLSLLAVKVGMLIPGLPSISREQVLRLNENKAFDIENARQDFGYSPLSFEKGVRMEMKEMGLL